MAHSIMVVSRRHGKVLPDGKLPHFDQGASLVINTNPNQSRVVAKFARRYGISMPLARAVAELAGFQMEVRDGA